MKNYCIPCDIKTNYKEYAMRFHEISTQYRKSVLLLLVIGIFVPFERAFIIPYFIFLSISCASAFWTAKMQCYYQKMADFQQ